MTPDELEQALCAQSDPEMWFSPKPGQAPSARAIDICNRCPVRDACLAEAIARDESDGLWGGVNMQLRYRAQHRKEAS